MTYIRFDDKRYNKNLFWSLERSKRKINISFQITFSFFVICRVQISDYTIYHHRKNIEFHFSFCFKLRIQKTNSTCALNPINYIKNNPNEHAHGAFCLNSKNVWCIYFTLHIDKIQEKKGPKITYSQILFFVSIWVFLHDHSRITRLQGKDVGISLTLHYHFHPRHRHLDISRAITEENSPLHIVSDRTRTRNLWFQSASC